MTNIIFVSQECHTLSFTNPVVNVDRVYYSREDLFKKIEEGIEDLEKQNVIMKYGSVGDHTIYNYPNFSIIEIENVEKYRESERVKFISITNWIKKVNPALYERIQKELDRRRKLELKVEIEDQQRRVELEQNRLKSLQEQIKY